MLISERFEGSRTPFEGDRLLTLRGLPEGAQVTKATVQLAPVAAPGGVAFRGEHHLHRGPGVVGRAQTESSPFAEVDFHARRTLRDVTGAGMLTASLQVDIGGLFVQINALGAMSAPDDGVDEFSVPTATGGSLPSLATQKLKITLLPAGTPTISRVGIRTTPSNLDPTPGQQAALLGAPG